VAIVFFLQALVPLAKRYFIFNFVEPAFTNDQDFEQKWKKAAQYAVANTDGAFISTYLHKTKDPNARFVTTSCCLFICLCVCFRVAIIYVNAITNKCYTVEICLL